MKKISFNTNGVCASELSYDLDDGVIKNLRFHRGCSGNLQALSILLEGMKVEDIKVKLKGIKCGSRTTSCVDQLVESLEKNIY